MPEFDKNALYIWACYALGTVLVLAALLHSVLAARAAKRRLERLEKVEGEK